jgi:hypothetical protein
MEEMSVCVLVWLEAFFVFPFSPFFILLVQL